MVIAPDKFKGSLTAPDVAVHLARGLAAAVPGVRTEEIPVADGGDGTVDAAVAAGYRRVERRVSGPTGEPVTAAFALSGPATWRSSRRPRRAGSAGCPAAGSGR